MSAKNDLYELLNVSSEEMRLALCDAHVPIASRPTTENSVLYKKCTDLWGFKGHFSKDIVGPGFGGFQPRFSPKAFRNRVFAKAATLTELNHYNRTIRTLYGAKIVQGHSINDWLDAAAELRKTAKQNIMLRIDTTENQYFCMAAKYVINSLFGYGNTIINQAQVAKVSGDRTMAELRGIIEQGGVPIAVNVDDIIFTSIDTNDYFAHSFLKYELEKTDGIIVVDSPNGGFGYGQISKTYGLNKLEGVGRAKLSRADAEWYEFINEWDKLPSWI